MAKVEFWKEWTNEHLDYYSDSFGAKPFDGEYLLNEILKYKFIFNNILTATLFDVQDIEFEIYGYPVTFKITISGLSKSYETGVYYDLMDGTRTISGYFINGQESYAAEVYNHLLLAIKDKTDLSLRNVAITCRSSYVLDHDYVVYGSSITMKKPIITSIEIYNNIQQIVKNSSEINIENVDFVLNCKYQYTGVTFQRIYITLDNFSYSRSSSGNTVEYYVRFNHDKESIFDKNRSYGDYIYIKYEIASINMLLDQSFFYSESEPLVVPPAGANFEGDISASIFKNNSVIDSIEESDLTFSRAITYNESKSSNVVVKTVTLPSYTYTSEYTGTSRTFTNLTATANVFVVPKIPVSIRVSGSDTSEYYTGMDNVFSVPEGLTYYLVYNDGTEEEIEDTSVLHFRLPYSDVDLEEGDTVPNGTTSIDIYVESSYSGGSYTAVGFYNLNYIVDYMVSLEITNSPTLVLGNYLSKDQLVVKATYASGNHNDNYKDYEITAPTGLITAAFTRLTLNAYGFIADFDNKYTFTNPTIRAITPSDNIVKLYNNGMSKIDLTLVKLTISYNNAVFTNEVTFGITATSSKYGVIAKKYEGQSLVNIFNSESENNYNGTTTLEISGFDIGSKSCAFVFSVLNYFDNTQTGSKIVDFTTIALTEIKGIKISNQYTEYKVGEKFLEKAEDNTQITIYWEDDDGVLSSRTFNLKDGYSSISIFPEKGTEFKNVDSSKQITIKSVLNSSVNAEYTIQVLPESILSKTKISDLVCVWEAQIILPNGDVVSSSKGVLSLYDVNDTIVVDGVRQLSKPNAHRYGYIDDILDKNISGKVVLFDDYLPEIDGSANMEITFPCYSSGEAELINNCTFGCLFGANNSVNRLFVSGNKEVANADWHTHELNLTDYEGDIEIENGNFSYIPSESVMYYGETDNEVVGYDIVSNDKLLVLKTKSDKEKTVYFRVPITVKSLDAGGTVSTDIEGNVLTQEEFGLVKGNNSVAGISPNTILNFNGDTLFVDSDNQVSGLDLTGIIGDNQRYANSRSKHIDFKLKQLNLKDSILWTNNKYLFLSIPNVGLFVTHFEAKVNDQYEWWYLTSHNPTVFLEKDGEIYFGNDTGSFCRLFNSTQDDVKKIFVGTDQTLLITFAPNLEYILCESSIIDLLDDNKKYRLRTIENNEDYKKNIYFRSAVMRNVGQCDVRIDWDSNSLLLLSEDVSLYEDRIYYLNYIEEDVGEQGNRKIDCTEGSELGVFGKKYRLVKLNEGDLNFDDDYVSFYLVNEDDEICDLSELNNAALCERLSREIDVVNINRELSGFQVSEDDKILNIVPYGIQNPNERQIKAEIVEHQKLKAYFVSAPMLASNLNSFKTIHQITLTNDTEIPSYLKLAIASNKIPYNEEAALLPNYVHMYDSKTKDIMKIRGDLGIDFNNLSFGSLDFENTVVPRTYTIPKTLGMQKFICFVFKNEEGRNAVLSEMAITYSVPFPSYGSD